MNFSFKEMVVQVQLRVLDGEWEIAENYGQTPEGSFSGGDTGEYRYQMARFTSQGWRLDRIPSAVADELAAWFEGNGWTDGQLRTYSAAIPDVVIEAKNSGAHVDLVVVDIHPGDLLDSVSVRAKSTCEPGDWMVIVAEQRGPGEKGKLDPNRQGLPEMEYPTAPPAFGLTERGEPRCWGAAAVEGTHE